MSKTAGSAILMSPPFFDYNRPPKYRQSIHCFKRVQYSKGRVLPNDPRLEPTRPAGSRNRLEQSPLVSPFGAFGRAGLSPCLLVSPSPLLPLTPAPLHPYRLVSSHTFSPSVMNSTVPNSSVRKTVMP